MLQQIAIRHGHWRYEGEAENPLDHNIYIYVALCWYSWYPFFVFMVNMVDEQSIGHGWLSLVTLIEQLRNHSRRAEPLGLDFGLSFGSVFHFTRLVLTIKSVVSRYLYCRTV